MAWRCLLVLLFALACSESPPAPAAAPPRGKPRAPIELSLVATPAGQEWVLEMTATALEAHLGITIDLVGQRHVVPAGQAGIATVVRATTAHPASATASARITLADGRVRSAVARVANTAAPALPKARAVVTLPSGARVAEMGP